MYEHRHPKKLTKVLTNGGEGGLRNFITIEGFVAAYDHPVERVADVFASPLVPVSTPPRIIHPRCVQARLVSRIWKIMDMEDLLTRVPVEKEYVDKIGLCEFGAARIP